MTVSVIKLDISKKKHQTQLYIYYFATEKNDLPKLVPLSNFGWRRAKWGTPTYSRRHAMAVLSELSKLTEKS